MENDEVDDRHNRTHVTQEADFRSHGATQVLPEQQSDTGKEKDIAYAGEDVKPGCPVCTAFAAA